MFSCEIFLCSIEVMVLNLDLFYYVVVYKVEGQK